MAEESSTFSVSLVYLKYAQQSTGYWYKWYLKITLTKAMAQHYSHLT